MVKVTWNWKIGNIQPVNTTWNNVGNIWMVNGGQIQLPWQVPSGPTSSSYISPWQKEMNAAWVPRVQSTPQADQPTKYDKMEWTTWWFNYNLDRAVSQADNQQGNYNALVWSWHVAWLPIQPEIRPSDERLGERLNLWTRNLNLPDIPVQPKVQQTTTRNTGTAKQQAPQQPEQPAEQPQENVVNPDEFGFAGDKRKEEKEAKDNYTQNVISNMESDLMQSTEGKIYGKVTWDQWTIIQTLQDAENVYMQANEARMQSLKSLLSNNPANIAQSIAWWFNPFGDMAMRDAMQYAPEFYKQIQDELKKIQTWETANAIASWKSEPSITKTSVENVNNWVTTWAEWVSSTPQQTSSLLRNISNTMSSNQVATTATQEMLNINAQIADYEEKLNNLEKEANAAFKGDAPDYLVKAYMSNQRQRYQSEINKLESRYNSAMELYKTELSNAQRQEEMKLKYLKYQQDLNNDAWTRYYQGEQLKQWNIKRVDWKAFRINTDWTVSQLTDATATLQYQSDVQSALQGYKSIYTSWWATKTANGYKYNVSWWQCETFTDNFTEATTWLRMTWAWGRWWTTAEEKIGYINSFVPEVWSVAVAVWWAYDSKYGHTMLVTWYDPSTWIVDLLWSNKNGDEMVYSTSAPLSQLQANWLKWFWNPYKDVVAKSWVGNYLYSWFNTPMSNAFERIASDRDLSATQRNALPIALEMYDTLYEISRNGQLDALVWNGDLALIMNDLKNKKFSDADRWEKFLDAFSKALINKADNLVGWDDSYAALIALQRVVEAKLRDESGAAISSSEWASNFSYLLPQAWESNYVKQEKLKAWDRIISTKFITAWWKMSEYVPIFENSVVREIWAD